MPKRVADPEPRLRKICMALPDTTERLSHSMPTWFHKDKKTFVSLMKHGHHQNRFPHFWCAAGPGVQEDLIASNPDQFFRPPYVGSRGWLGVRLPRRFVDAHRASVRRGPPRGRRETLRPNSPGGLSCS